MVTISDGYYMIKIGCAGKALKLIQDRAIMEGSVVKLVVHVIIENEISYYVKQILHNWGIAQIVGDPKKYVRKKINPYSNQKLKIFWKEEKH